MENRKGEMKAPGPRPHRSVSQTPLKGLKKEDAPKTSESGPVALVLKEAETGTGAAVQNGVVFAVPSTPVVAKREIVSATPKRPIHNTLSSDAPAPTVEVKKEALEVKQELLTQLTPSKPIAAPSKPPGQPLTLRLTPDKSDDQEIVNPLRTENKSDTKPAGREPEAAATKPAEEKAPPPSVSSPSSTQAPPVPPPAPSPPAPAKSAETEAKPAPTKRPSPPPSKAPTPPAEKPTPSPPSETRVEVEKEPALAKKGREALVERQPSEAPKEPASTPSSESKKTTDDSIPSNSNKAETERPPLAASDASKTSEEPAKTDANKAAEPAKPVEQDAPRKVAEPPPASASRKSSPAPAAKPRGLPPRAARPVEDDGPTSPPPSSTPLTSSAPTKPAESLGPRPPSRPPSRAASSAAKAQEDVEILPSQPPKKALTPVEELEERLNEMESVGSAMGRLLCSLCSAESGRPLPHLLSHLHRKSHQCAKCPNRLANKNLLKHFKQAHARFCSELTNDFLRKNIAELLELAETCFGLPVSSEDTEINETLKAAVARASADAAASSSGQFNCTFKGVCGRVFDFQPSPEAINAHIIMHFTKQPFFKCEKCKHRLRSSLHAHEGQRDNIGDIRHTFRTSYLDVLRQSFLAPPKRKTAESTPTPATTDKPSPRTESSASPSEADSSSSFGPSSSSKGAHKRRNASPSTHPASVTAHNISDSPPTKRRGRPPRSANVTVASIDDGIEVVSVNKRSGTPGAEGGGKTPSRRDLSTPANGRRSTASPSAPSASPAKTPPLFLHLRQLANAQIAITKKGARSTIMQCQSCKQVLFVSDGVERLENHVIGHMEGSVSVCEQCGKRFSTAEVAQHNRTVHASKARFLPLNSQQDVTKKFVSCFPESAEESSKIGAGPGGAAAMPPVGGTGTAASPTPAKNGSIKAVGERTGRGGRGEEADPQARGKAVQRELEARFESRAADYIAAEQSFLKCPLKECGATIKVSGVNLSGHVTFHSNKPLFVCLYGECRKKVKDIELHVRLTHPSFTTYEDLRPQFMPYLLRLLDLCFPPVSPAAKKPQKLPDLKPTELMTPDALLKATNRASNTVAASLGKKSGETPETETLDVTSMKLFFSSSEIRWAAYTAAGKLIQCYKCDANGTLSTFIEDTTQLRQHIVEHVSRQSMKCHLCEKQVSGLPKHIQNVHPKTAPGPEGLIKLDPLLLAALNACLPPLPDEPEIDAAKNVPKRDVGVGSSRVSTRSFPTQTPNQQHNSRSVGVMVLPPRSSVETQTIDAWTGRRGQEPISEPQTRAELLLYKIEVLDLIELRVKESRASTEGKLFCRAHGCAFNFVYSQEASPIHQAVAYVESHILEKHLSGFLFECLVCEKKVPNINFHWSQYHDDMSIMPWYYTDSRRAHLKKLKTAVGVCFPFENTVEAWNRGGSRAPAPCTPRPTQTPLSRAPALSTPLHRAPYTPGPNKRMTPGPAVPPASMMAPAPPPTGQAEVVEVKPTVLPVAPPKRPGAEVECLEPAKKNRHAPPVAPEPPIPAPPPPVPVQATPGASARKRGRPSALSSSASKPTPASKPAPAQAASRPSITSTPISAAAKAAAVPKAIEQLDAKALRIFNQVLRGIESFARTPGKPLLFCGLCKKSMGKAGGTGADRPLGKEEVELHVAGHSTRGGLLHRCLLCSTPENSIDAHFRSKHGSAIPIRDVNYADIRLESSQQLLLQLRACFPRVRIEPLDPAEAGTSKSTPAALRKAPPTPPLPSTSIVTCTPTPSTPNNIASQALSNGKTSSPRVMRLGTFKVPPTPTPSCSSLPSFSTAPVTSVLASSSSPAPTTATSATSTRTVAAIIQNRDAAARAAASSPGAVERAAADARSSSVSVLVSALDPDTLARHLPPVSSPAPSTPRREARPPTVATPRRMDADCSIVGGAPGDGSIAPMMEKQEVMDSGFPGAAFPFMPYPAGPYDPFMPAPFMPPFGDPSMMMMPPMMPHMQ